MEDLRHFPWLQGLEGLRAKDYGSLGFWVLGISGFRVVAQALTFSFNASFAPLEITSCQCLIIFTRTVVAFNYYVSGGGNRLNLRLK